MKLIVQPRDGLTPLITAIRLARKEVDIIIFRCDRPELQQALETAVGRGVKVRTLIAHLNRGGEKNLRKLEQQLLDVGATVARTGDEFVRYHGKMAIVDRATLFVLGFNFTGLDVNRSRSFGIITKQKSDVAQALRLFEADVTRQPFEPGASDAHLVVSPENARSLLSEFMKKAKKQLLIYDPKVSDSAISKLLKERLKAGVDVRIIGKVALHEGQKIDKMEQVGDRVEVTLTNGEKLQADHVMCATGYKVNIKNLSMIHPSLLSEIQTLDEGDKDENTPVLNHWFESSVPGLYFLGLTTLRSFGPLYRFVVGTKATAERVASSAARRVNHLARAR